MHQLVTTLKPPGRCVGAPHFAKTPLTRRSMNSARCPLAGCALNPVRYDLEPPWMRSGEFGAKPPTFPEELLNEPSGIKKYLCLEGVYLVCNYVSKQPHEYHNQRFPSRTKPSKSPCIRQPSSRLGSWYQANDTCTAFFLTWCKSINSPTRTIFSMLHDPVLKLCFWQWTGVSTGTLLDLQFWCTVGSATALIALLFSEVCATLAVQWDWIRWAAFHSTHLTVFHWTSSA